MLSLTRLASATKSRECFGIEKRRDLTEMVRLGCTGVGEDDGRTNPQADRDEISSFP